MAKLCQFDLMENTEIARNTYSMLLFGDTSEITAPGQFVNITVDGCYLPRPFSVCKVSGEILTLVYKVVGKGTKRMSQMKKGRGLTILTGLGNGFPCNTGAKNPILIGGGLGAAPLYELAEVLCKTSNTVSAILGFQTADDVYLMGELAALGVQVAVATVDGSLGVHGFVTDALEKRSAGSYDFVYACGPEAMLKAVYDKTEVDGAYSFEARMACGFGACMGCACETRFGSKRICKDGPVFRREEIVWQ